MNPNEFGLPTETDVFEEIARSEQQIKVTVLTKRYGKKATLVAGFDKQLDLRPIGKRLKEELACGGTTREGEIELLGNHRKKIKPILVSLGFAEDSISD